MCTMTWSVLLVVCALLAPVNSELQTSGGYDIDRDHKELREHQNISLKNGRNVMVDNKLDNTHGATESLKPYEFNIFNSITEINTGLPNTLVDTYDNDGVTELSNTWDDLVMSESFMINGPIDDEDTIIDQINATNKVEMQVITTTSNVARQEGPDRGQNFGAEGSGDEGSGYGTTEDGFNKNAIGNEGIADNSIFQENILPVVIEAGDKCIGAAGRCIPKCNKTTGFCSCPEGYRLDLTAFTCSDINECLLRNGHGPCQDTCVNKDGGYLCSCDGLPGTQLSTDNHTCIYQDSCQSAGCSHSCVMTHSGPFCLCPIGFELGTDVKTCEDINECEKNVSGCTDICVNSIGSYSCVCPDGFRLSSNKPYTCEDIDECESYICSHICSNKVGTFQCSCPDHMDVDTDNKTCISPRTNCSHDSIIVDGRQVCTCPVGFHLTSDNITCKYIDHCADNPCSHFCENNAESFTCTCPIGYKLNVSKLECIDIEECEEFKTPCSNSCITENEVNTKCSISRSDCFRNASGCSHLCVNTIGSYTCACPENYRLENDSKTCSLIDPCLVNNGGCAQDCLILQGEVHCSCREGYVQDGAKCTAIDLCFHNNGGCSHECNQNNGKIQCTCPEGFTLENSTSCVPTDVCDIESNTVLGPDAKRCMKDRCLIDNGGCSHYCNFSNGLIECTCPPLFDLDLNNRTCVEAPSCEIENGGCSHRCSYENDSIICSCPENYRLKNKTCYISNPCSINNGGCSDICTEHYGAVICSCPDGFTLVENACQEIDPCALNNGGCSYGCEYINGNVLCFCPENYHLKNNTCEENSLCLVNNGGCSHECIVQEGNVVCKCPKYYVLRKKTCVRADPCLYGNGGCSHFCTSVEHKVECKCPPEYILHGKFCVPLSICRINNGGCSHTCVEIGGKPKCRCPKGYKLTGKTCVHKNKPCHDKGRCSHDCVVVGGIPICRCPPHYKLIGNTCIQNNPCDIKNGGCSHICTHVNQTVTCSCPQGYKIRYNVCYKEDPCTIYNGGCSHICKNINGEVHCDCPPDYILLNNECHHLNPCHLGNGGCSDICQFINGTIECACKNNQVLVDKKCYEKNSCKYKNGGCSHVCEMENELIKCSCPKGFRVGADLKSCVDIDECALHNGGCTYKCENVLGSFRCNCPAGYVLSPTKLTCVDRNECDLNNANCEQLCVNSPGSYNCACKPDYLLNTDRQTCSKEAIHCRSVEAPLFGERKCFGNNQSTIYEVGSQCVTWCHKGYKLVGETISICTQDGSWDNDGTFCEPVTCPRLSSPENGKWTPSSCSDGNSFPGDRCLLSCHKGYRPTRLRYAFVCLSSMKWNFPNVEQYSKNLCVRKVTQPPYIKCPNNGHITATLGPKQSLTFVHIPRAETNVDWWRFVHAEPSWGKLSGVRLPMGQTIIRYTAWTLDSVVSAKCELVITVQDIEPPTVVFCPANIIALLKTRERTRRVYWQEPVFTDNVAISKVQQSAEQGDAFGVGVHPIVYTASDIAGNNNTCQFTITLREHRKMPLLRSQRAVMVCSGSFEIFSTDLELPKVRNGCHIRYLRQHLRKRPLRKLRQHD